jgi:hypothetical protein
VLARFLAGVYSNSAFCLGWSPCGLIGFEVLTAVTMKASIFRDINSTEGSVEHITVIFMAQELTERETSMKQAATCRWRRYVPMKRRLAFTGLHGVISQEIELFMHLI